jgi:hypothetical protein
MSQFDNDKLNQFLRENSPEAKPAPMGEKQRISRRLQENDSIWQRLGWRRYLLPVTAAALLLISIFPITDRYLPETSNSPSAQATIQEAYDILYIEDDWAESAYSEWEIADNSWVLSRF